MNNSTAKENAPESYQLASAPETEASTFNDSHSNAASASPQVTLTFFDGDETDCIPFAAERCSWDDLRSLYAELAKHAPGADKASNGYAIACIVSPSSDEALERLDPDGDRFTDEERAAILELGYRNGEHITHATALVVDYDGHPEREPDWRPESWPCEAFAHSSHSWHPTQRPGKWRVFLRLAEPIPMAEYAGVKAAIQQHLPPGAIVRAAHQPAFLPTCPTDMAVQFASVPGAPLDWRKLPRPQPKPTLALAAAPLAPLDDEDVRDLTDKLPREWPPAGNGRHDAALALGGTLRRLGTPLEQAEALASAVLERVDPPCPVGDRVADVRASWKAADEGRQAYGHSTLQALLVGERDDNDETPAGVQLRLMRELREAGLTCSVAAARRRTPEVDAKAAEPKAPERSAADDKPRRLETVSAADLCKPLPPVSWLCKSLGIAPGRPTLVVGKAGSGKTLAVQDLALAVAAGKPAFNDPRFAVRQGAVLHIDLDQGRYATTRRYQQLATGRGLNLAALPLECAFFNFSLTAGQTIDDEAVDLLAQSCVGHTLVVIDSLRGLTPGLDENSSEFGAVLQSLSRVADHLEKHAGAAPVFLVLHHSGKGESTAAGRGTSAIQDRAGAIWKVEREEGDEVASWTHEKVSEMALERCEPFRTRIATAEECAETGPRSVRLLIAEPEAPRATRKDGQEAIALRLAAEKVEAVISQRPGRSGAELEALLKGQLTRVIVREALMLLKAEDRAYQEGAGNRARWLPGKDPLPRVGEHGVKGARAVRADRLAAEGRSS